MENLSPMMKQYMEIKQQYKDTILLFRVGDFYEMFFEDAIIASRDLEITLTGKDCGMNERAPMCGVPFHSVDTYIAKLIEKGHKAAICEQLENPATTKGIVRRDVIRIITPGTVIENNMLDEKKNNYIMMIYKQGMFFGITICDITTGDLLSTNINKSGSIYSVIDEIAKYSPTEVIVNEDLYIDTGFIKYIKDKFNIYITNYNEITKEKRWF